jgi:hypothetical protein
MESRRNLYVPANRFTLEMKYGNRDFSDSLKVCSIPGMEINEENVQQQLDIVREHVVTQLCRYKQLRKKDREMQLDTGEKIGDLFPERDISLFLQQKNEFFQLTFFKLVPPPRGAHTNLVFWEQESTLEMSKAWLLELAIMQPILQKPGYCLYCLQHNTKMLYCKLCKDYNMYTSYCCVQCQNSDWRRHKAQVHM